MWNLTKILSIGLSLCCGLIVTACQAQNTETNMSPIKFENGATAQNCEEYNTLSTSHRVAEEVNNQLIRVNYLKCSLGDDATSERTDFKADAELLDQILNNLKVRQLPTSMSQQVEIEDTFKDAGFDIDPDNNSLVYNNDPERNFKLELKSQLNENRYLIWVTDEILSAGYKAYYAAVLTIDENDEITAAPFYEGGY